MISLRFGVGVSGVLGVHNGLRSGVGGGSLKLLTRGIVMGEIFGLEDSPGDWRCWTIRSCTWLGAGGCPGNNGNHSELNLVTTPSSATYAYSLEENSARASALSPKKARSSGGVEASEAVEVSDNSSSVSVDCKNEKGFALEKGKVDDGGDAGGEGEGERGESIKSSHS